MGFKRNYLLYGCRINSDFDFCRPLVRVPGHSKVDLAIKMVDRSLFQADLHEDNLVYLGQRDIQTNQPSHAIYSFAESLAISYANLAEFYLHPEGVDYYPFIADAEDLIEGRFISVISSFWLESQTISSVLHASSVMVNGKAVAFLANSLAGKSTLAALLIKKGYPLIADDVLRVTKEEGGHKVSPGYPGLHLSPASLSFLQIEKNANFRPANRFMRKYIVASDVIAPNSFYFDETTLGKIYLPVRDSAAKSVEIETLSPSQALYLVTQKCFHSAFYKALGWRERKLSSIAALVNEVEVKRITFPEGFEYLDQVTDMILADNN